jgi:SpoVK/Ycf46/Vps4 family AAA+-type ATPase
MISNNLNCSDHVEAINIEYGAKNFNYSLGNLMFKKEDVSKIIEKLKEVLEVKVSDFKNGKIDYGMKILSKENKFFIDVALLNQSSYIIDIYGETIEEVHQIFDIIKEYETRMENDIIFFDSLSLTNQGLAVDGDYLSLKKDFKNLKTEFYPYLNYENLAESFLKSEEKILIFLGETGLGKSKIIKHLIKSAYENKDLVVTESDREDLEDADEENIRVATVKDTNVLSSPAFWKKINNDEYHFCLLDDLDDFLIPRKDAAGDKNKKDFMSQFLSSTDGIFENNCKFIISTNQTVSNIDDALLRRGRCFDILELRTLKREEAINVWTSYDLEENIFIDYFPKEINSINQSDLGSEIKIALKKKEDEKNQDINNYLLEEGISVLKKVKKKNQSKIGFN